ncbi:MAG: fibronectin type III domain-containing protein [Terriglobales bacterium]
MRSIVFLVLFGLAVMYAVADAVKITKGPVVEHVGTNNAVIAWSTNVSSATIVKFGTDPNNLDRKAQMPWGGITHRVTLKNLEPGKTYYFVADSSQGEGSGGAATSQVTSFTTAGGSARNVTPARPRAELKLANGPVLEHVGDTTAVIAWSTSLPSSTIVKYGTDRNNLSQTAEEPWGQTTHRMQLKNLKPKTQYFFSVHSGQGKNAPGQKVDTEPQGFVTK